MKILIIEDDYNFAHYLKLALPQKSETIIALTGNTGILHACQNDYHLIIIDLGLPDITGIEVCYSIRDLCPDTPILILSGKSQISCKVSALDAGADDYLTKPFNRDELLARIRALTRRNDSVRTQIITISDLKLDLTNQQVTRNGLNIKLRKKEFALLEYLARNQNKILTREMIISQVWCNDYDHNSNTINVHIKWLRDKIDRPFGKPLIQTVHGCGYRIRAL